MTVESRSSQTVATRKTISHLYGIETVHSQNPPTNKPIYNDSVYLPSSESIFLFALFEIATHIFFSLSLKMKKNRVLNTYVYIELRWWISIEMEECAAVQHTAYDVRDTSLIINCVNVNYVWR